MSTARTVFITGCSSGIGAALAEEFHRRGHVVYATARRLDSLAPLAAQGLRTLALDVNDDASIAAALAEVAREAGKIDVLVNNAGYGQFGAMIDLDRDTMRRQLETNVISPVAVTRAALALLRQAGDARVVNIGSISGIVTTPFAGIYCASKAALHSISDALRMELAPFGVHVVTVQPGGIASKFGANGEAGVSLPAGSLYAPIDRYIKGRAKASQKNATPAEEFSRAVVDGVLRAAPPAELRLGNNADKMFYSKRLLPTLKLDKKFIEAFGLSKLR